MPRIFLPWVTTSPTARWLRAISGARRQLQTRVEVDWKNPLNNGLAYLYTGIQSVATRKPIFSKGAADIGGTPDVTLEGTPGGLGIRQNGSSIFRPFGANANLSSAPGWSNQWTRFAMVYADAAPGSGDYAGVINGDKAGAMTWNHPSGGFQGVITAYYLGYYSASFGTLNGKTLYILVGTHNSVTGNLRAYKNGVLQNQTVGVNAVTSDTVTESFGYDAGGNPFPGVLLMVGALTREWSPEEVAQFSRDPWALFKTNGPFAHLFSTVAAVSDFTALLAEGATLSDTIGAVLGISASATEAATLADTLDGGVAFTAAATESMTLSDAVSLIYGLSSAVSEALALDAAQDRDTSGAFSAAQTDSSSLGDSAAAAFAAFPVISEALALADALSGAMAASADAGDALTLDEAATRVLGLFSQASEASALDDLSDSVRGVTGGVTEALTAADAQAAALSSFARIDESMTLSELAGSAKGYAVAIVGALALLEALRARLDRAFAAAGARGGRPALDTGSRGGRAASTRLGRTDSSRRTRH